MADRKQNYKSHTRFLPPFHFFVIPVLFVNGRLFAKVRIPKLAPRLRLLRAAAGQETGQR